MSDVPFTVLLYAPTAGDGIDLQTSLEDEGYQVVRAATLDGFDSHVRLGGIDLVIFDDPPWELMRGAVGYLDAAPESVPRIWVSSWSEAPGLSSKLGVDALVIAPTENSALVERVATFATPRSPGASGPLFAQGSQPGLLRPGRAATHDFDDEPTAS